MRTLGNLSVPKNENVKFPFGATIQNETDTLLGTPVVEELNGDVLMNVYKLLQTVGVTPTETQDNNDTQFQILEALKKLPNTINDVEHLLDLDSLVWSIPVALEYVPNNFVCFAKATSDYVAGSSYTFKGTGALELSFSSVGFKANDTVLIIVRSGGVVAINLSVNSEIEPQLTLVYGLPLSYNNTNELFFQNDGVLVSNTPTAEDIQSKIRVQESDGALIVDSMFKVDDNILFSVIKPGDDTYLKVFCYKAMDFSTAIELVFTGATPQDGGVSPYIYCDGIYLYITNNSGASAFDYEVDWFLIDIPNDELTFTASYTISNTFEKTTNAVCSQTNELYVFDGGTITKFSLNSNTVTSILNLGSVSGQMFIHNSEIYFSSGQVASLMTL